jgi:hypothetical protein
MASSDIRYKYSSTGTHLICMSRVTDVARLVLDLDTTSHRILRSEISV